MGNNLQGNNQNPRRGCLHERTEYKPVRSGGYLKQCQSCKQILETGAKNPNAKPAPASAPAPAPAAPTPQAEAKTAPGLLTEDL